LEADDPFRLTLLSSAELIPINKISSYTDAQPVYMQAKYDTRQTYHIFAAEQTASYYEEMLVNLNQGKRQLSDRVVLLLEDEDRLAQFLMLLAHGVIYRADVDSDGQTQSQWVMELPERRNVTNFWWLTMPADEPMLLNAVINFAVVQDDARSRSPQHTHTNPFGADDRYHEIMDFLKQAQREDAVPRIESDNLALKDPEVRKWLEAFLPPLDEDGNEVLEEYTDDDEKEFLKVAQLVARRDILADLSDFMKDELPHLEGIVRNENTQVESGTAHDARDNSQEEYDFYSVSALLLDKEIGKIDGRIERLYRRRIGDENPLGGR